MLVGAHVSPSGGLYRAIERGTALGARAIQIFNQSPRAWRPTAYGEDDFARFREAMDASEIGAVLIHAVYLLNCASDDREIRARTLASLIQSLRVGDGIGAHAVVVHPGRRRRARSAPAIDRAGEIFAQALAESDRCPLHLENTAGAGGTLGRTFTELAALLDAGGAGARLGVCLDSCHLLASGYEIRTPGGAREGDRRGRGRDRQGAASGRCISTTRRPPLGSNRDRHANIGDGELGIAGAARVRQRAALRRAALRARDPGPRPQRADGRGDRARDEPRAQAAHSGPPPHRLSPTAFR